MRQRRFCHARWFTLVAVAGLLLAACYSDYSRAPIDVSEGAWVVVEPGDEFAVGLLGHPTYPDATWVITEIDDAVADLQETIHTPRAGAPPPVDMLPDYASEIYSTMPDPDRPPDYESEDEGQIWYVPDTRFLLAGGDYGETDVVLELWIEGELSATFEFSVSVVEEACEFFVSQDSSTKVPHRCG